MNWMVLPNQVCLIVKLYNNRPELLPDSNVDMSSIKLLNDNNFNYLYNPGENGEFKIINKNETSRLVSWTMVAGDEKSRVWA